MPGLNWDLNLDPELQAASRRLSFSDTDSPSYSDHRGRSNLRGTNRSSLYDLSPPRGSRLSTIYENSLEQEPGTPAHLSQCTAPPSSMGTSGALFPALVETPPTTTGALVVTSLALAPPAPSQSQQSQEAVARMLEQRSQAEARALFGDYQRQRQEAVARMLEQRRQAEARALFGDYQRQRQDAGLQQQLLQQQARSAAARPRSRSQQLRLYTVDGDSAGYETKWEELHPVSQGFLLYIEDNIREYRDDSERLDLCSRLDDLSLCNMSFALNANQITQVAGSISMSMDRGKISIQSLMTVIKEIMWKTDFVIRSYIKLRLSFVQRNAGSANSGFADHSGFSGSHTDFSQLLTVAPTYHYSGAPRRPSPFLQHTVARFEDHLGECCKWILELEQLFQMKDDKTFAESLESLLKVMSNVLDYVIHLAAKVEHIHQYVETMKTQYLNDRRRRGDLSDPFLKENRREAAKQEAAARIVRPVLHLSPPGQPTTPVAALIASQLQQT